VEILEEFLVVSRRDGGFVLLGGSWMIYFSDFCGLDIPLLNQ